MINNDALRTNLIRIKLIQSENMATKSNCKKVRAQNERCLAAQNLGTIKLISTGLDQENHCEMTLHAILGAAAALKCKFCEGLGHHVKQCASLKNINNSVKNLPAVKIVWGL